MDQGSSQGRPGGLGRSVGTLVCVTVVAALGAAFGAPYAVALLRGPAPTWKAGALTAPLPAVLSAIGETAVAPTAAGVSAVLAPLASVQGLGSRTAISVVDLVNGQSLFNSQDLGSVPASTTKIVTAATVLTARGPTYQLTTRVVAGAAQGEVVIVGAGDPTIAAGANGTYPGAARLDTLAAQVSAALGSTTATKVIYDTSLFSGAVLGPGWDADIPTGGYGAVVSALTMDGARTSPQQAHGPAARSPRPDLALAQAFAKALGLPSSAVTPGVAPAGARELGHVDSPPLSRLVEFMLTESDNVIAEALARQVAIARTQPASFEGAAAAMKTVLGELGLPTAQYGLVDGSGLSRSDRLSAGLLTSVLALAARPDNARLHSIFSGLPVAGYSGTLQLRFDTAATGGAAAGNARAKTGSLSGVSSLAGIVVDADGRALAFAILADAANKGTTPAQESMDRIVAALAGCGCR